jgi:hypothetical protein
MLMCADITTCQRSLFPRWARAPVIVHQRVDFGASVTDDRTVGELHRHYRTAEELTHLWTYVDTQLRTYGKEC